MVDLKTAGDYVIDFMGDLGPKYQVYDNRKKTKAGLRLVTPKGFPHKRQIEYIESQHVNTFWGGQRGSGKTEAAVWDNLFTAYRIPGSRQGIFRRTMGELQRTIISSFLKLPEELRGKFTNSVANPRLDLPNGSVIEFASINDENAARKYLSGEYTKVTFDEWCELPFKWWSFVTGSVRTSVGEDILGRPVVAQIKGMSNPGGQGANALRNLFGADCAKNCPKNIDMGPDGYAPEDYLFIPSIMDDNPAYKKGTRAGDAYRKMLMAQPKAIREAWLNGKWTGFEGMYFECFEKDLTEIPHDEVLKLMNKQFWMPVFIGIDWGQVHHAYINWNTLIAIPLSDGSSKLFVVTFDEMLVKGLSERALAEEIVAHMGDNDRLKSRINRIYLSPETFGEMKHSRAANMGDVFVTHGLPRPTRAKAEKWSRPNGLRQMYSLLAERNELMDKGWGEKTDKEHVNTVCDWLISDNCPQLLAALPWAVSDPERDGDIRGEGDDPMLDVLDGIRYAIYSHYVAADKPAEEVYREKMELITQGGINPTRSMKMYAEFVRRMKEVREQGRQEMAVHGYARRRHPRIGKNGGDDMAKIGPIPNVTQRPLRPEGR